MSRQSKKAARKSEKLAKDKTSTSRKNLDIQENLMRDFRKQFLGSSRVTLGAVGTEPVLREETAEESSASAPEAKRKKPGRKKREEEKPILSESPSIQAAPGRLKNEPAPEDVNEAKEDGQNEVKEDGQNEADKLGTPEPLRDFATQRESIEELDPKDIQTFYTIPDYLEPTSSLYPIVVKTPESITCLEGWPMIQQALGTGQETVTCHIYHLAEVSEIELALRKVASRTMPQGGIDSYSERARNCKKCKELIMASNENLVALAHGGARRGITFTSLRERNVNLLLAERFGKSEDTTNKYLLHAAYLNDEAFQVLVEGKTDKKFFESFHSVKIKLVENLKGQRVPDEDILNRVSEEILRVHRAPKETRNQEIKNLLDSLNRVEPQQSTNAAETAASQPAETIAHEEGGGDPQEQERAEERLEEAAEEDKTQPEERPEPSGIVRPHTESKEDQTFDDEQIRRRGIEIAEGLRAHFGNSEISPSAAKRAIRGLIESLESLLAEIPDA